MGRGICRLPEKHWRHRSVLLVSQSKLRFLDFSECHAQRLSDLLRSSFLAKLKGSGYIPYNPLPAVP